MTTLSELRVQSEAAWNTAKHARTAYRRIARRRLIAELASILNQMPEVSAFTLSSEYEYDDEGGYPRYLTGDLEGVEDCLDYWTEGLDVDQEVILELFGIEDCGDGRLTREQVRALAVAERVEV